MSGLAGLIWGAPFIALVLVLLYLLRRERLRGPTSTTHPVLVGFYKGCAFVLLILFALPLVVGIARSVSRAVAPR